MNLCCLFLLLLTTNAQVIQPSNNYLDRVPQEVLSQILDELPTYKDVANFAKTFKTEASSESTRLGRINTQCGKGTLKMFTHDITFINVDHPIYLLKNSDSVLMPHFVWDPNCIATMFDYVIHYPLKEYNFTKFAVRLTFEKNYAIEVVNDCIRKLVIMMKV